MGKMRLDLKLFLSSDGKRRKKISSLTTRISNAFKYQVRSWYERTTSSIRNTNFNLMQTNLKNFLKAEKFECR